MAMKISFLNDTSPGEGDFWYFTSYLSLSPNILYNIIDDVICLLNYDTMFNLDDGNIEELWFCPLLGGIIK